MTPDPVPPPLSLVAEIVTTLGTTLAAMPVVWLTSSVSLTVTVAGPAMGAVPAGAKSTDPAYDVPSPAAPPTSAAATMMPATLPAPERFLGSGADHASGAVV